MFFDVGLKNTVNYSVFGHLTLKNHGICSGFCFSLRKNTVNNSNFAVFSCFSLFFELLWSAIHGCQILRVFFRKHPGAGGCQPRSGVNKCKENANGHPVSPFFIFDFPFFPHLFCFLFFSVLKFCFLMFHLFSFFCFFSSLRIIRLSYRGEHNASVS